MFSGELLYDLNIFVFKYFPKHKTLMEYFCFKELLSNYIMFPIFIYFSTIPSWSHMYKYFIFIYPPGHSTHCP